MATPGGSHPRTSHLSGGVQLRMAEMRTEPVLTEEGGTFSQLKTGLSWAPGPRRSEIKIGKSKLRWALRHSSPWPPWPLAGGGDMVHTQARNACVTRKSLASEERDPAVGDRTRPPRGTTRGKASLGSPCCPQARGQTCQGCEGPQELPISEGSEVSPSWNLLDDAIPVDTNTVPPTCQARVSSVLLTGLRPNSVAHGAAGLGGSCSGWTQQGQAWLLPQRPSCSTGV